MCECIYIYILRAIRALTMPDIIRIQTHTHTCGIRRDTDNHSMNEWQIHGQILHCNVMIMFIYIYIRNMIIRWKIGDVCQWAIFLHVPSFVFFSFVFMSIALFFGSIQLVWRAKSVSVSVPWMNEWLTIDGGKTVLLIKRCAIILLLCLCEL